MAPHALVIGGTGMLRAVCLGLAAQGVATSVVARGQRALDALRADAAHLPSAIHPIQADYTDLAALEAALRDAIRRRGPLSRAVCWVHGDDAPALTLTAGLAAHPGGCDLLHVLGSAAADPTRLGAPLADRLRALPGLRYRRAILGFCPQPQGARWLTDAEIAAGVLDAVHNEQDTTVIGAVHPWSARPR
jgi:NAD(P)-dependent dehydrogenase (short-subunit alcohol dehydrogenase family)